MPREKDLEIWFPADLTYTSPFAEFASHPMAVKHHGREYDYVLSPVSPFGKSRSGYGDAWTI